MQLLNKYKIFLSFVFSLLLLFCFCPPTQAKNRSIILPPPHNISPQGEVTEDKVIFEWHNDNIPPEYNLKYYVLEVTSNINERGGDFNHGLSLKVEVDKAYTRFPPTGDGFDTKKLFTDTQGRFAWRVTAFYNCADGIDSEKSVPMSSVLVIPSRIELTDMGNILYKRDKFQDLTNSPYIKSIGTLDNGKWACIFLGTENCMEPMINIRYLQQYLGCQVTTFWSSKNGKTILDGILLRRYDQYIYMNHLKNNDSQIDITNIGSDFVKSLNFPINKGNTGKTAWGSPYWYKDNSGNDVIYVKLNVLKWIGVNNTFVDKTSSDSQNWYVKMADQGLKKDFQLYLNPNYGRVGNTDYPKGHYYIMPIECTNVDNETLNQKLFINNSTNKLSFGSTHFNLRCAGRTICAGDNYCGGFCLIRFELLEGLAKLIYYWEKQDPAPSIENLTKELKIDGSYRCKYYNWHMPTENQGIENSGHIFGLKADLDLNLSESVGSLKQASFRNWCDKEEVRLISGLTPSAADPYWADLKYDCGSNGPWFYFVNKDFKIGE